MKFTIGDLYTPLHRCIMSKTLILFALCIFSICSTYAQTKRSHLKNFKIKVLDSKTKEPLIGASVLLNNIQDMQLGMKGIITDANGEGVMKIHSQKKNILEFRYVGYVTKKIKIDNKKSSIEVFLVEGDVKIDDVVVIGYQTQFREKITGNISTAKSSIITNIPTDSPIMALQGRMPGVYINQNSGLPGSGADVIIRGIGTFGSQTSPLYIIDGLPYDDSHLGSTSGETGYLDPLTMLNPNDIESISVLKDADATSIYGSRGANGVVIITTKKGKSGKTSASFTHEQGLSVYNQTIKMLGTKDYLNIRRAAFAADKASGIDNPMTDDNAYDLTILDPNYSIDWFETMLGTPSRNNNTQLSLNGGSKTTNFIFNLGLNNMGSVIMEQDDNVFRKINARLGVSHLAANGKLSLDGSFGYNNVRNTYSGYNPTSRLAGPPNLNPYNPDGTLFWLPLESFDNPMNGKYKTDVSTMSNFLATTTIGYNIIKNLDFKATLGYTLTNSNQLGKTMNGYLNPFDASSYKNYASYTWSLREQFNVEPQLTYITDIKNHHINILLGATYQSNDSKSIRMTGYDFPLESMMGNIDSAERAEKEDTPSSQYRFSSVFTRLGYEYKNKYLVNTVLRRDGSSRFAPGSQFGNFWSIAGSWLFHKESFIEDLGFISSGKLRASYGTSGNDGIGDYKYLGTYESTKYPYEGGTGFQPSNLENNNFKWEVNNKFELGLEVSMFNHAVFFQAAYFNNRSSNQLVSYPLPSQSGFSTYQANLDALVENKGFELAINTTNIKKQHFSWTTDFSLTLPKNTLLAFPNLENTSYYDNYEVGKSINVEYIYKYTGIDRETGIPTVKDLDEGGVITNADKYFAEGFDPTCYGGLVNTFKYKGFDLSIFFQFSFQKHARNYRYYNPRPAGYALNVPVEYLDYWTPENKDSKYPGLTATSTSPLWDAVVYEYRWSDAVLSPASYLRLKNVNLSYNFQKKALDKIGLKGLRVYMNAINLFTATKYFGWDPETLGEVPPASTVMVGFNVTI